jgi:hypothetical protein
MDKKIFRKFGYYKDQDGIINRYLRETEGWNVHLEKTKNFILKASANKAETRAVILGSGWLLDVPFLELSQIFKEIILVDIKHPRQVVHQLRNYKNIKCLEADICGLTEQVYKVVKENGKNKLKTDLESIKPYHSPDFLSMLQSSDFVVSVNLLNQLDILICDYLIEKKTYGENEILAFRKFIQMNHIGLLPINKSAVITDYLELNLDKHEQVINRKDLVHINLPEKNSCEKWTWDFDSQKTYREGFKTVFKVMAFEL